MWGRRKGSQSDAPDSKTLNPGLADTSEESTVPDPIVEGLRANGPWDAAERDPNSPGYVDIGSIRILGREGVGLQLPVEKGVLNAIVVIVEGSAMELRAFADARSGGQWAVVLDELVEQVTKRGGESNRIDGPFGEELLMRVPVKTTDGRSGVQQSRIIGVEGPRWVLRATLLGQAGVSEESAEGLLSVLRDVIVVRGEEPRMLGEGLPLKVPAGANLRQPAQNSSQNAPGAADQQSPPKS